MTFAHLTCTAIIASLLLLPACGPQDQKPQLKLLKSKTTHYQETKNGITVNSNILTPRESQAVFGPRGKYLAKHGIMPLQISIINKSNDRLEFDSAQLHAPRADNKKVISCLTSNTSRSVCSIVALGGLLTFLTGIVGLGFWGMYAFTGHATYLLGLLPVTAAIIGTSTGSIYTYKQVNSSNTAIIHEIRALTQPTTIEPGQTLDTLLFLDKSQFDKDQIFSMAVKSNTGNTTFTINLRV